MRVLIIFEDTYGVADIFKKFHSITEVTKPRELFRVNEDVAIVCGMGQRDTISIASEYCSNLILESGAEVVISVFDLDNLSGDNSKILQIDEFRRVRKRTPENVSQKFIPVCYAAETLMLMQFILEKEKDEILRLVCKENTKRFQKNLLKVLLKRKFSDRVLNVKKVADYLSIQELKESITNSIMWDSVNHELHRWIFDDMKVIDNLGLGTHETEYIIETVNEILMCE